MRFTETPRKYAKESRRAILHAFAIYGIQDCKIDLQTCERIMRKLKKDHDALPKEVYFSDGETQPWNYIHLVYAYCLANAVAWKVGEVIFREKDHTYDSFSIVSTNNEYMISISMISETIYEHGIDIFMDLYEKIKSGNLPPSEPDKFLDLLEYFYPEKEPYIAFEPLDDEQWETWIRESKEGAAMLKLEVDEKGMPVNLSPMEVVRLIEIEILRYKPQYSIFTDKGDKYIRALAALYGQCLKMGSNFILATTWTESEEGIEGEPVLHSEDKHFWISPLGCISRELISSRKTCKLLRFYRKLHFNRLPPPDGTPLEEIT